MKLPRLGQVVPDIEFSIIRGLPAKLLSEVFLRNAARFTFALQSVLFRLCSQIQEIAQREVEENVGSVSIFTVAEAVKEFLADNNEEEKTMFEEVAMNLPPFSMKLILVVILE